MTVFGLDGKLLRVHNIKGAPSPMRIYPMNNSYLTLHMENRNPEQYEKTRLGHMYSPDFSKQKAKIFIVE